MSMVRTLESFFEIIRYCVLDPSVDRSSKTRMMAVQVPWTTAVSLISGRCSKTNPWNSGGSNLPARCLAVATMMCSFTRSSSGHDDLKWCSASLVPDTCVELSTACTSAQDVIRPRSWKRGAHLCTMRYFGGISVDGHPNQKSDCCCIVTRRTKSGNCRTMSMRDDWIHPCGSYHNRVKKLATRKKMSTTLSMIVRRFHL